MTVHVDHLEVSTSLAEFSLSASLVRPFPPAAPAVSALAPLTEGERRALTVVCGAFLAGDDPYLEADELAHLAGELEINVEHFHRDLVGLGLHGLLGIVRSRENYEIEQVESTRAGMEAYCRSSLAERYETLLCEVARRLTSGIADGPTLRQGLPWEPGLLLTHVVETLAAEGWLTVAGHFGESCGWQVAGISSELQLWAAVERNATPNVWTMRVVELDTASAAA